MGANTDSFYESTFNVLHSNCGIGSDLVQYLNVIGQTGEHSLNRMQLSSFSRKPFRQFAPSLTGRVVQRERWTLPVHFARSAAATILASTYILPSWCLSVQTSYYGDVCWRWCCWNTHWKSPGESFPLPVITLWTTRGSAQLLTASQTPQHPPRKILQAVLSSRHCITE